MVPIDGMMELYRTKESIPFPKKSSFKSLQTPENELPLRTALVKGKLELLAQNFVHMLHI